MRWTTRAVSLGILALAPLAAQELKLPPNLGAHATESVDVTLDSNMLQLAVKFLSDSKPDEAEAKKLVAGLKSIVVKSFEFAKPGEYNPADLEPVRAQFRGPGWSRMVGVQSRKGGENAEVFLRNENGKIGAVGIVVAEAKEVTIVSIVGTIDPAQIGALAGKFGIPKIDLERKKKSGKDD